MVGQPLIVPEVAPEDMPSRLHFATTQGGVSMLNANPTRSAKSNQLSLLFWGVIVIGFNGESCWELADDPDAMQELHGCNTPTYEDCRWCNCATGGPGAMVTSDRLSRVDLIPSASGDIGNSPTQSIVLSPIKCVELFIHRGLFIWLLIIHSPSHLCNTGCKKFIPTKVF